MISIFLPFLFFLSYNNKNLQNFFLKNSSFTKVFKKSFFLYLFFFIFFLLTNKAQERIFFYNKLRLNTASRTFQRYIINGENISIQTNDSLKKICFFHDFCVSTSSEMRNKNKKRTSKSRNQIYCHRNVRIFALYIFLLISYLNVGPLTV